MKHPEPTRQRDPLAALDVRPGIRLSVRLRIGDGFTDRIGVVVEVSTTTLTLEDRDGERHPIPRSQLVAGRQIPTVSRGRDPRRADPTGVRTLLTDPALLQPGPTTSGDPDQAPCWIGRLSDVVDSLDDAGVRETGRLGLHQGSRATLHGEWCAMMLETLADLRPLASWAARRGARNVALMSPLPAEKLRRAGLSELSRARRS